jgi:hypothetical protein
MALAAIMTTALGVDQSSSLSDSAAPFLAADTLPGTGQASEEARGIQHRPVLPGKTGHASSPGFVVALRLHGLLPES